nr:melanocortin receptor 4-like [Hydra vulgaris]
MLNNSLCQVNAEWKTSIIDIVFSSLGIFICGIGLYILIKVKKTKIDKTQWYIITNLCILDVLSCITLTVNSSLYVSNENYVEIISQAFADIFMLGYYGATLWLVFDRYLHIVLNIKYVIYWSKRKTITFTLVLWIFCILLGSLLQIYCEKATYILLIIFDTIIVLFSIFVYATALKIYYDNKQIRGPRKQPRNVLKGMLVASLILSSYLILMVIPDIIIITTFDSINYWSVSKFSYLNICYIVAMWVDALVYVVVCPQSLIFLRNRHLSFQRSNNKDKENPKNISVITSSI